MAKKSTILTSEMEQALEKMGLRINVIRQIK